MDSVKQILNQALGWAKASTRNSAIAVAVVLLAVACTCGGALNGIIQSSAASNAGATSSHQQANGGNVTNTPHGPTATPTKPPTPTATPKPKAWTTVDHYSGSANQQTATIHVPDGSRIVWKASASDQYGGTFSIEMYNSDNTLNDLVANTSTPPDQTGTYNIHSDLDVYFKIDTYGCNWDIQVQEYK